jgi:hypothetical protein
MEPFIGIVPMEQVKNRGCMGLGWAPALTTADQERIIVAIESKLQAAE